MLKNPDWADDPKQYIEAVYAARTSIANSSWSMPHSRKCSWRIGLFT